MNNADIAKTFKGLGDETRIKIIKHLQSGSKCACNIGEELDIAQSKLSYHMKILCESKIVECWYIGKWTHYKLSKSGSARMIELIGELTKVDCVNCDEESGQESCCDKKAN